MPVLVPVINARMPNSRVGRSSNSAAFGRCQQARPAKGCPEGSAEQDWLQAEQELKARSPADARVRNPGIGLCSEVSWGLDWRGRQKEKARTCFHVRALIPVAGVSP